MAPIKKRLPRRYLQHDEPDFLTAFFLGLDVLFSVLPYGKYWFLFYSLYSSQMLSKTHYLPSCSACFVYFCWSCCLEPFLTNNLFLEEKKRL